MNEEVQELSTVVALVQEERSAATEIAEATTTIAETQQRNAQLAIVQEKTSEI